MFLYFENSYGNKKLINNSIENKEDALNYIYKWLHENHPNFIVHYVRSWGIEPVTFDVGSHTEFFLLYKEEIKE